MEQLPSDWQPEPEKALPGEDISSDIISSSCLRRLYPPVEGVGVAARGPGTGVRSWRCFPLSPWSFFCEGCSTGVGVWSLVAAGDGAAEGAKASAGFGLLPELPPLLLPDLAVPGGDPGSPTPIPRRTLDKEGRDMLGPDRCPWENGGTRCAPPEFIVFDFSYGQVSV